MRFMSVCSGIEAASEAWKPLGWMPCLLSEIEPAPRAVLEYRHDARDVRRSNPLREGVALWGDFTALRVRHLRRLGIPLPDILVGGTPCQSFSIAGLRKSLADARGNLTFAFVRLANAIDNARRRLGLPGLIIVWENVPGVFSTKDNAFGCFLGGLVGSDSPIVPGKGQRWTRSGLVIGPRRATAWTVKDAQYFGLAQRRERVFAVSSPLDGPHPGEILFEPDGVRRHFAPSREARKDVAGSISRLSFSGGPGGRPEGAAGNHFIACDVSPTLRAGGNSTGGDRPPGTDVDTCDSLVVTHSLRGEGFDASEDGTGRGIPLTVTPIDMRQASRGAKFTNNRTAGSSGGAPGTGIGEAGDPCPTLANSHIPAIAFSSKDHGADATNDLAPTLRAMGHAKSRANAGGQLAVAWSIMPQNSGKDFKARQVDVAQPLMAGGPVGGNQGGDYIQVKSSVRRLIVIECERLQGFRDNYTLVPYRNGWMADGPRYRMLGNSMARPVMAWLGERIAAAIAKLTAANTDLPTLAASAE